MPTRKKKTKHNHDADPTLLAQRAQVVLGAGVDFYNRRLYIVGDIGTEMAFRVMAMAHLLDETQGPITVMLSSPGGSEPDGYAIYDCLRLLSNPTVIIGFGAVQSIAALIFQAGSKRLMTSECRFMIHNGSIELPGATDANALVSIGKEVEQNNDIYHRILAERSGLTLKAVRKLCQEESYFDAKGCVEHGFADAVLLPNGDLIEKEKHA